MAEHTSWFDYAFPLPAWEAAIRERFGFDLPLAALLAAVFVALLVVAASLAVRRRVADPQKAIVPDADLSLRTLFELVVDATYGMMKSIMTPHAARHFLPLVGTAAFFILTANLLGLVPGFVPPTATMGISAAGAIIVFLTTHVFGLREHGFGYFKHFVGPIRKWYALPLMLLMLGIELISHAVRPVSLSIRLTANMFADHAVVGAFYDLVAWSIPIPVMTLGILVCIVQTLVFCLLSTIYISMAIAHEEH